MNNYHILTTNSSADYELIDSGEGEKLERYGKVVLSRPDPQALWNKRLPQARWSAAGGIFTRDDRNAGWRLKPEVPVKWDIEFGDLRFWIKPSAFKHTGLFPEHLANWNWVRELIKQSRRKIAVLNIFGYTGGITLAAAQAGAEVCHLEGSKPAITWARENAEISGLSDKPVRWILDDAVAFVAREVKRGRKYDGIIMDPPAFGHGPKGEMWKIEEHLLPFLELCRQVLSEEPLFFLINGYASGYSAIAYKNNLDELMQKYRGKSEMGELTIKESGAGRLLPAGIFARWRSE